LVNSDQISDPNPPSTAHLLLEFCWSSTANFLQSSSRYFC